MAVPPRDPLRIALLAAPMVPVPPIGYGGTERVVAALAAELASRGHDLTVFASGDSTTAGRLVPVTPTALWPAGHRGDVSAHILRAVELAWRMADQFDVVHSHLEGYGFPMARHASTPVVSTLHGRLDTEGMPELLDEFADIPLVAISESQRRWAPDANWLGVVHNGLPLDGMPVAEPRDYLAFVGRIAREKGVAEAIDLADRVRLQLKMAAKIIDAEERRLFDTLVRPALDDGRVAFLGELPPSSRDPLMAAARATLMLGAWPEPFGLVAIESLAAGTPVIARRAGALPEIIEHGIDGYLVDDVDEAVQAVRMLGRLDRARIRRRALARFTPARMADRYEEIYRELIAGSAGTPVPMAAGEATGVARVGRETEAPATVVVR